MELREIGFVNDSESLSKIASYELPYQSRAIHVPATDSGPPIVQRYLDVGPQIDAHDCHPILCVHGNPTWSYFYRHIVKRFGEAHRVIAVDHVGCGRSDKPGRSRFDYCLDSHVENLVRIVLQLDLRNITLLAHDWGGAIGLSSLLRMPDRFRRIVLLNTAAFPPPYIPLRIGVCRWPVIGPLGVRGLNLFARAAQWMTTTRAPLSDTVRKAMIAPYDSWANRIAIDSFVHDIPMHPSHRTYEKLRDLEEGLSKVRRPTLLVWGMKDWCFRPECLDRFEAIWPHAKVNRIDDAGHYVLEDATADVLASMESFLTENQEG